MSTATNYPLFLTIFLIILFAVSITICIGLWLVQRNRRKQLAQRIGVTERLSEAGEIQVVRSRVYDPSRKESNNRANIQEWALAQIEAAGLKWPIQKLLSICGVCLVLGVVIGLRASRFLPAYTALPVSALICSLLPFFYLRHLRSRRVAAFEKQLPEALEFLARSMRVGNAFPISLELLAAESEEPLRTEFQRATSEIRLGAPVTSALQNLLRRVPLIDLRMFVSAVLLQKETGGNLTELLTRLAATIRDRFRLRGQVDAAAAQGKLTAGVLTVLPVAVGLGIMLLSPDYLQIMTNDEAGRHILLASAIAQVVGYFVMRKIIRIKV